MTYSFRSGIKREGVVKYAEDMKDLEETISHGDGGQEIDRLAAHGRTSGLF
jgi:hypothetical protein